MSCRRTPPRAISDLEISEALCQGVKGGKRVAPTELEDTKACRRGLLLLESTRLQYAMKTSLVGVISCSPAPFCCCGGRQSDVREHLQTSFNRGVRALSLARTPMLQLDDTGEGPHAPEHHYAVLLLLPLADQGETLSKENGGTRESWGCWLVGW